MSTTFKKHFPPDAGDFIPLTEAKRMRANYDSHQKKKGRTGYTKAYFFGKDKIKELLECNEEIVGIRIYYGKDTDGDGIDDKKMVIYPVDKKGNNVPYHPSKPATSGVSFMSSANAIPEATALDGGLACPSYCPTDDPDEPAA